MLTLNQKKVKLINSLVFDQEYTQDQLAKAITILNGDSMNEITRHRISWHINKVYDGPELTLSSKKGNQNYYWGNDFRRLIDEGVFDGLMGGSKNAVSISSKPTAAYIPKNVIA
jgi:hypothetical protein